MESLKHFVNSRINGVKSLVLTKTPQDKVVSDLREACVPVSTDACRTCADPCDVGHLEYPPKFDVDTASDMLGSVKPYMRQVIISTGRSDWVREVTEENGSLAQLLSSITSDAQDGPSSKSSTIAFPPSKPTTRVGIINGSHKSQDDDKHRVLILPDYKVVDHVAADAGGARDLYQHAITPKVGRLGTRTKGEEAGLFSYPLPYACVILLCSHKRRDNRCHIAAPKLETSFCRALESENWIVHHDLTDNDCMGQALEEIEGTDEERDKVMADRLREASEGAQHDQKVALILKISHIGGHKYAGNVIIYIPQGPNSGTGVWYGRVSPHEVPAVVRHTIIEGEILPEILRGGINMNREQGQSLLDW